MSDHCVKGNAIVGQSGGPTAVINESLVGVIEGLRGCDAIGRLFGARSGVRGIVNEQLIDLTDIDDQTLDAVARTPSAALGSTRDKPDKTYCEQIFEVCKKREIHYFFYIGGNDSSDTCRIVNDLSTESGYELRCFHVPKTIDNDLMENDHTPGYPSAARYVAMAFLGDGLDNASLPGVKVNVVMGRHAGFLTAASALARQHEEDAPHLIYTPETDFDPERFVGDVDRVLTKLGRCQIAVSEGIHNAKGESIGALMSGLNEKDAHGNVQLSGMGALGDWLAHLLRTQLTPLGAKPRRVRADTLGYLQRCFPDASPIDRVEARQVGAVAAQVARSGDIDASIAIRRVSDDPYHAAFKAVDLKAVAGKTRMMPAEFLKGDNDVSQTFLDYARPLVGAMPRVGRLPSPTSV